MKQTLSLLILIFTLTSCSEKKQFYLIFDNVSGLSEESPVLINGYKIGEIEKLSLLKDQRSLVLIDISEDLALPSDSEFRVEKAFFIQDAPINVQLGTSKRLISHNDTLKGIYSKEPSIVEKKVLKILKNIIEITDSFKAEKQTKAIQSRAVTSERSYPLNTVYDTTTKTIHIIVALCDNKYQGIVPVPDAIGNGQDPKNNLYWGTAYGIKTYFKRSAEWSLVKQEKIDSTILERLVFKHRSKNYFMVADAYNGRYIKDATKTFLRSSAGITKDTIKFKDQVIGILGNSKLLSFIGHDGLMDFTLNEDFSNSDNEVRDVIILACYSKNYFAGHLEKTKAQPLLWTTGLMAPEAYTIHDALTGYVKGESKEEIRIRAAKAYDKYQKCGLNTAKNLFVTD